MFLWCDGCGEAVKSCVKVPCAFSLEFYDVEMRFIMPNDEEAYRNFCVDCLILQSKEQDE